MSPLKEYLTSSKSLRGAHIAEQDMDFISPVVAATLKRESHFARMLLYCVGGFIIIFLVWAAFAQLDEITRANGKVIPSSQIQRISHLDGGAIEKILVHEGDVVEKGQILLQIDNTLAAAKFKEGQENYYRYFAAVERLKAQLSGQPFKIPEVVQKNAPGIARDEQIRYDSQKQKLQNETSIAQQEVAQKREEMMETRSHLEQIQEQLGLMEKEIGITEPLAAKGLSSKIDLLKSKRDAAELKGQLEALKATLEKNKAALEQAEGRLKQVPIALRGQDLIELRDAENRLAAAQGSFTSEGYRVRHTEIRSPVRGIVNQLMVTTVGGVVKPGQDLVEIVPLEDTLLIEAKVKPADIAFLRPGLPANIKITAYDFSIYGGLKAELVHISSDAIPEENKPDQSFYRVRLRTLGNKLSKSDKILNIIPGMTTTVDIMTGKKSVLDYLLKPIIKTLNTSMSER